MKIWFSWVLILVVISSFAFADIADDVTTKIIDVSVYSIKEDTKLYDIYAEYPQIDKANTEFNERIKSVVKSRIADFKEISKDNWETRRENSI